MSSSFLINDILARYYPKRNVIDDERDSPLFVNRSNYIYRVLSSSVVAGNYLYIDGGEIYYNDGNHTTLIPSQSTYSIDVSSSWTNTTVVIKQIDKSIDGRILLRPKLWPAVDNSSFYSYNGVKSWIPPSGDPPPNKLYKFTSDGSGGGQWSEEEQSYTASSNFTNLVRVGGSAKACGPDTCYFVGGWRCSSTDNAIKHSIPAAGIVSYNLTSRQWYNDSLVGSVFKGPWSDGQLFFTDVAGSEGVLIAIGGIVTNLAGGNPVPLSFSYAYMYDIATKSWYQQITGGDVPLLSRRDYCTVGLQGDNLINKTYEIFMYGGRLNGKSSMDTMDYADVWVLSIPSFQWHRAGQPNSGRLRQSCTVAGHRQMIIIGGNRADGRPLEVGDDWPFGLGVFDLSEMVFKDRFEADASVYTSPQVVKRWYATNGSMAKNISEDVKGLFDRSSAADHSVSSVPTPTEVRSPSRSSVSITAMAGGVVGGVVLLAAVFAFMCICRKRRRRRRRRNRMPNISQPFNIRPFIPKPIESDGQARCEADGRTRIEEADSRGRYEVDGHQIHEL